MRERAIGSDLGRWVAAGICESGINFAFSYKSGRGPTNPRSARNFHKLGAPEIWHTSATSLPPIATYIYICRKSVQLISL